MFPNPNIIYLYSMFKSIYSKKSVLFRRVVCGIVGLAFILSLAIPPSTAQLLPAGSVAGLPNLPAPGQMIGLTPVFQPAVLRGMTIHPENPLQFDFIVDRGQNKLGNEDLKLESEKLIKYFLASMTVPDKEAWVNLSPYEKNRIIPDALGQTEMGRQMLEQDYILKQISASLTNPDTDLGKRYWDEVNRRLTLDAGRSTLEKDNSSVQRPTSNVTQMFNKVWIVPASATVVEKDGFAYITESKLNVMLDEDYLARPETKDLRPQTKNENVDSLVSGLRSKVSGLSTQVFREMILPKLVEEVNTGKNFSPTRQVYQSVVLAAWYKKTLKDSLLGRIYADKSKVLGVETDDKDIKQKIYDQYIEAFKKGAYNIIKEEGGSDGDLIPRKYFSGGLELGLNASSALTVSHDPLQIQEARIAITARAATNDIASVEGSFAEASTGEVFAVTKAAASSSSPIEKEWREVQILSGALTGKVNGILSDAVAILERSVNKPQVDFGEEIKELSERLNAASVKQGKLEERLYLFRSMSSYMSYWGGLRESSFKISVIRNLLRMSAEQTQNRVAAFENEYTRLKSNGFLDVETRKRLDIIILRLTNRLTGGVSPEEMAKLINAKFEELFPQNKSVDAKKVFTALAWNFIYQLGSTPNDDDLEKMIGRVWPISVSLKESKLTSAAVRKIMIDDFKYDDRFRLKAPLGILVAFKEFKSQFNH